jgi:putative transposase
LLATKSVTQSYSGGLDHLLTECLTNTYNAINYAEEHGIDNRRRMKGFYRTLKDADLPSCYKVASITRACAIVKSRKKSEKRGIKVTHRKPLRPMVCVISGFFVTMKGRLFIPLRRDKYFDLQLNQHTLKKLADKKVRSLTMTPDSLSFCYSEDVEPAPVERVYGVDRNEKNVTFGDREMVIRVDMTKVVKIRQTTREIIGSFKRSDVRIRGKLARKYWRRANHRTDQILHAATNYIVDSAAKNRAALAIEDLTGIRRMYRRGNGQEADYRFRLNSWLHLREKKMIEYKAAWNGVTIIQLTKSDTFGSSSTCSACGEKLHSPAKDDVAHRRMLWCQKCKAWVERDVNAAQKLSIRGRSRLDRSLSSRSGVEESRSQPTAASYSPIKEDKGLAGEAVKGNGMTKTTILRVDASKLIRRRKPKS